MSRPTPQLEAQGITVAFGRGAARNVAVRAASVACARGEVLGLVGESGSGKTTLGRVLAGLQRPDEGEVILEGNVVASPRLEFARTVRSQIQMVFQDPYSSLNPSQRGWQAVAEVFRVWHSYSRARARAAAMELLEQVGVRAVESDRYPADLSGGQRQRISVARALAVRPGYLIADEPTSSIDQSAQAQLLTLLKQVQSDHGLGLIFITHDLRVVRYLADRICVMQAGQLVEEGPTEQIFDGPSHSYTRELLASAPGLT